MPNEDDKQPDETKPEVTFKTKADFHAEVDRKIKSATKQAGEKAIAEFLGAHGLDADALEQLKGLKEQSVKTQTEAEKLKGEHGKLSKDFVKLQKERDELHGFKITVEKGKAMAPFAQKFRASADLEAYLAPRLTFGDDGKIAGVDGKSIDDTVKALFDEYPHLRAPDYKDGAGTRKGDKRPEPGTNGTTKYADPIQGMVAAMAEQARKQGVGP